MYLNSPGWSIHDLFDILISLIPSDCNTLTSVLVFSNSKILIVLFTLCSFHSLYWIIKLSLNWDTVSIDSFWFCVVLSHYIATYDTHFSLSPNFHTISAFIITNDWHLRQMKKFLVARFDDSLPHSHQLIGYC